MAPLAESEEEGEENDDWEDNRNNSQSSANKRLEESRQISQRLTE